VEDKSMELLGFERGTTIIEKTIASGVIKVQKCRNNNNITSSTIV
jgi:hypothetical protein